MSSEALNQAGDVVQLLCALADITYLPHPELGANFLNLGHVALISTPAQTEYLYASSLVVV